ncbi:unnamed protein product, partial [Scytosiphon promiscuus]
MDEGTPALLQAVCRRQVGTVRALLQEGANPDYANFEGFTPLMLVSHPDIPAESRMEMADALLQMGANPWICNDNCDGLLPIHYAALGGDTLLVEKFLAYAPDTINARSRTGLTPLQAACG